MAMGTRRKTALVGRIAVSLLLLSAVMVSPARAEAYRFVTKWGSEGSAHGQFDRPWGVAVDASGKVYVADTYNHRIQKFTSDGAYVAEWGSYGSGDGQFYEPRGVAVDAAGRVFVADSRNHRVQKFTSSGTFRAKWGSYGVTDGQFIEPTGVAVDASANVYVADRGNHRIQKFTPGGTFLTTWGSLGSGNGQLNYSHGVAVDASGNAYVADTLNHRIQKFTLGGAFITKWGSAGSGDGEFKRPIGVAVDAMANVYVVDYWNSRIQKFTSAGLFRTKWGTIGFGGDGQFHDAHGVAVDASGNVYVADTGNHRVQKFASDIPRLEWAGTQGFTNDGVKPNSGPPGATFTYKVKYTDLGGGEPLKATCRIYKLSKAHVWQFSRKISLSKGTGDISTGAIYRGSTGLDYGAWRYRFHFQAAGGTYLTDDAPASYQRGPEVGTPTLTWAGTQGLTNDGVKPNSGPPDTTFTFGVAYADPTGDDPLKATCRIYKFSKAHVWQFNRKIDLAHTSGLITTGAIYEGTTELPYGRWKYRFHFQAADGTYLVDDPPATYQRGPVITRTEPATLSWAGTPGYTSDGVGPNRGTPGATSTFKVKYTDPMGLDPVLRTCTVERCIAGSWRPYASYRMEKQSGAPATGAIYSMDTKLPNYTWRYQFVFKADGADAPIDADPPALWQQGPLLKGPPRLYWAGEAGYASDGVRPNTGPVGTRFTFKVMCQTSDIYGPMPGAHDLVLRRNGNPYKTKEMANSSGKNRTGRIYSTSVTLTKPGDYTYRFSFANSYGPAKGDPTTWQAGPDVTTISSLSLSSLSAAPTNVGAQLTFTLSSVAQVEARVLNIAGRPVKAICSGRACEAGANTLLWNAMSDSGTRVPNGMYLVEVAATAEDGNQTRALARIRVGR